MTMSDYLLLLRRRWLLVLGLPLLVALLSGGVALTRPARYQVSARAIVTRGVADPNSTAGMTWAREDTVAQDVPTIISSAVFAADVRAALARQGLNLTDDTIMAALSGANDGKIVTITATASNAAEAQEIAQTAVAMLHVNGLRYWGDPTWTPERPGVNIGLLDGPGAATALPTQRDIVLDALLRAAVALLVAVGLAVGLTALEQRAATGQGVARQITE